jgi:hypothetical protein
LELLYDKDKDTKLHWNRVTEGVQPLFQITDKNLSTTATFSGDIENNNLESLNTSVKRQQGVSTNDLVATVNATLIDCLEKAEKQKKQERQVVPRELANLKKVFDATSAMMAIVNKLDNNTDTYNDFKQMHDSITTMIA